MKFFKTKFALFLFYILPSFCLTQEGVSIDTILPLPKANVHATRLQVFDPSATTEVIDSNQLVGRRQATLAEVLEWQSSVFIKNYGPGRLATSSIRGGNAAHTSVLWNGMNLQSPTLGQVDFSLLPMLFFEEAILQKGGNSALWGSAAIGGVIHLNNTPKFQKKWEWRIKSRVGSYRHFNQALIGKFGTSKSQHIGKFFHQTARNDFSYRRSDGSSNRLNNSSLHQSGMLLENYFRLTKRQQIGILLWAQQAKRGIPPTRTQLLSIAEQEDKILRTQLHWKRVGDQMVTQIRVGLFKEQLFYDDAQSNIHSQNESLSWVNELENKWYYSPHIQATAGIQHTMIRVKSSGFETAHSRQGLAFFTALSYKKNKWHITSSARQEVVDGDWIPFVPAIGTSYFGASWLTIRANITRNYRLPTFNDRYWSPGGNPDILPEHGWSESISALVSKKIRQGTWRYTLTGFHRLIHNQIIWLPETGSIWSPQNLGKVRSRGLEQSLEWQLKKGNWQWRIGGGYDWIFATNIPNTANGTQVFNKQLIYLPKHKAKAHINLAIKNLDIRILENYIGKTYTTPDHSGILDAYFLTQVLIAKTFQKKSWRGQLYIKCNNLFDKEYEVVVSRPMPGRHFEIGIDLAHGRI